MRKPGPLTISWLNRFWLFTMIAVVSAGIVIMLHRPVSKWMPQTHKTDPITKKDAASLRTHPLLGKKLKQLYKAIDMVKTSDVITIANRIEIKALKNAGDITPLVLEYLNLKNINARVIEREINKRVSVKEMKNGLEIARQNSAAVYFSLPILKSKIKEALLEVNSHEL